MQTNDFISASTTDIPVAVKTAGTVEETKEQMTTEKADESGETAEIKAQDAVKTDDQDAEADDTDVDAGDDDQKTEEEKAKPKKKGGFQRKLEKQEFLYQQSQQEIENLKRQLEAIKPRPELAEKAASGAQEPQEKDFDSFSEYIAAKTKFEVKRELEAAESARKQQELALADEKRVDAYQSRIENFKEQAPDFDEVIGDLKGYKFSEDLASAILDSEVGPLMVYTLAKDFKELHRINMLPAKQQLKEIVKLETKLESSLKEPKPEPKQKTSAPPPPKPVGTKSPGKVVKDPSEMTPDEYLAWRRKK